MDKFYKYQKLIKQVSLDGGETWQNTEEFKKGELLEENSKDCGYIQPLYRFVVNKNDFICIDGNKYTMLMEEKSIDNGISWVTTGKTKTGNLIQTNSNDCI